MSLKISFSNLRSLFSKVPINSAAAIIIGSLIIAASIVSFAILSKGDNNKKEALNELMNQDKYFAGMSLEDKEHILGNNKNKINIVVYSDFECPFCKKLQIDTIQKLQDKYKNGKSHNDAKIGIVYRHFAQSYHKKAETEINASLCTRELYGQESYINFINRIYEITPTNDGLDLSLLPEIAKYAVEKVKGDKLSMKKDFEINEFSSCLNEKKYNEEYLANYRDAIEAGLDGTPYSVLMYKDGDKNIIIQKMSGARDLKIFEKVIDKLLDIDK